MKQNKKKKSHAYRREAGTTRTAKRVKDKRPRQPLTNLEKLLLAMLGISILATAISFFTEVKILTYITIANYIILGLLLIIKPDLIVRILRKNIDNYDEDYRKKELYLTIGFRIGGLAFLGIAYLLLYNLGYVPNILPF